MKKNITIILIVAIIVIGSWGLFYNLGVLHIDRAIAPLEIPSHTLNIPTQLLLIYEIVECESNWDNSARGLAGEIGLAQFLPETFEWLCKLSGMDLDIYEPQDQLKLLDWSLRHNRGYLWTCYRKITR